MILRKEKEKMKKNLLTTLMCLCTIFALTACGENENSEIKNEENETVIEEIDDSDDSYDLDEDEDSTADEIVDPVNVILYSELTGSSYRITVDRSKIHSYCAVDTANKDQKNDVIYNSDLKNDDIVNYLATNDNGTTYYSDEDMTNGGYNSLIKDVEWRKERGYEPSSQYSEEWTDCLGVYEYRGIEYTVNYTSNGGLDIFVKNPYTEVYDLRCSLIVGENNPDYLKFAEKFIDRIEFID